MDIWAVMGVVQLGIERVVHGDPRAVNVTIDMDGFVKHAGFE